MQGDETRAELLKRRLRELGCLTGESGAMNDDEKEADGAGAQRKLHEPLPGIPVYEFEARDHPGPLEQRLAAALGRKEAIYRFAEGNCRFTNEDLQKIAAFALANLPLWAKDPLWIIAAELYLLGMLDGVAMQIAQAELDAQRVKKGQVM